jgi:predicted MFS family arabinose efflux permease
MVGLTNKAVPSMMLESALQPKGTFWFFFVVAFLGLLWAVFLLPETSHRGLEETSEISQKWDIWLRIGNRQRESSGA